MSGFLLVGLGGALGAMARYGVSLLPFRGAFPLLTLATNLLGAVLIGLIARFLKRKFGGVERLLTGRAPADPAPTSPAGSSPTRI